MSLIRCPACERRIAASAKVCPKCGHEVTESQRRRAKGTAKYGEIIRHVGLLAVVGGMIGGCSGPSNAPFIIAGFGVLMLIAGRLK